MPFQLLTSLMDIDTLMTKWRCEYATVHVCVARDGGVQGEIHGAHLYETPKSGARAPEADGALNIHSA